MGLEKIGDASRPRPQQEEEELGWSLSLWRMSAPLWVKIRAQGAAIGDPGEQLQRPLQAGGMPGPMGILEAPDPPAASLRLNDFSVPKVLFLSLVYIFSFKECVYCGNEGKGGIGVPSEEHLPAPGLSEVADTKEEGSGPPLSHRNREQT